MRNTSGALRATYGDALLLGGEDMEEHDVMMEDDFVAAWQDKAWGHKGDIPEDVEKAQKKAKKKRKKLLKQRELEYRQSHIAEAEHDTMWASEFPVRIRCPYCHEKNDTTVHKTYFLLCIGFLFKCYDVDHACSNEECQSPLGSYSHYGVCNPLCGKCGWF